MRSAPLKDPAAITLVVVPDFVFYSQTCKAERASFQRRNEQRFLSLDLTQHTDEERHATAHLANYDNVALARERPKCTGKTPSP